MWFRSEVRSVKRGGRREREFTGERVGYLGIFSNNRIKTKDKILTDAIACPETMCYRICCHRQLISKKRFGLF